MHKHVAADLFIYSVMPIVYNDGRNLYKPIDSLMP